MSHVFITGSTEGLGLMAAAAGQGFVGSFNGMGLRAQPAVAPAAPRNPAGPPQGKWIRLAPFPQATGELLGAAINGKLYKHQLREQLRSEGT